MEVSIQLHLIEANTTWMSDTMPRKWIRKCGYLPFYKGIMMEHRGVYADFNVKELF